MDSRSGPPRLAELQAFLDCCDWTRTNDPQEGQGGRCLVEPTSIWLPQLVQR
jgi:hypothetical protein